MPYKAPSIAGSLAASNVASSAAVNLTRVGTSDWAHWPGNIRKASGAGQISNFATVGGNAVMTYTSDPRALSWSDGTPSASGSDANGLNVAGAGNGYQLTAPADTTTRTLTMYVGGVRSSGQLTAHLSDGSSVDFVNTATWSSNTGRYDGVYTLTYRAASAGQTLSVKWTLASGKGSVSLQGAALVGGPTSAGAPPPPASSACPCNIWSSSAAPTVASAADSNAVEVGVKFKSDSNGLIGGIRFYKGGSNVGTHVGSLWSASGQLLAQATFTNEGATGWQQVLFATPVAITANTVYVASYHTNSGYYAGDNNYFANTGVDNGPLHALSNSVAGGNGVYAYGANSTFPNASYQASNYWVDVVFTPTNSIWANSAIPGVAADADTSAVEVGVKFQADKNGYIGGIRYYKSGTNTGVHVGSLWSASGQLLAQAQFANESVSGWQQVVFANPIAVTAGTVYVASYHTNVGNYAGDNGFFASAGVDSAPLHALKDGVSGGNGVYVYSATPAFPNASYQASNYWVDVLFVAGQ